MTRAAPDIPWEAALRSALDALEAQTAQAARPAHAQMLAQARALVARYVVTERPWRLLEDHARAAASLQREALEGWLGRPERAWITRKPPAELVALLDRALERHAPARAIAEAPRWPPPSIAPDPVVPGLASWRALSARVTLGTRAQALVGLLGLVALGEPELTAELAGLGVLRPAEARSGAGVARSLARAVLGSDTTAAEATLHALERSGLAEPVPGHQAIRAQPALVGVLRALERPEPEARWLPDGLTLWPIQTSAALDALHGARWPEARPDPGAARRRALLYGGQTRGALSVGGWWARPARWLLLIPDAAKLAADWGRWLVPLQQLHPVGLCLDASDEVPPPPALIRRLHAQLLGPLVLYTARAHADDLATLLGGAPRYDLDRPGDDAQSADAPDVLRALADLERGPLKRVANPTDRAIQADQLLSAPTKQRAARVEAIDALGSAQMRMGASLPFEEPRCPCVLTPKTLAEVQEITKVLAHHGKAREATRWFGREKGRFVILLEGARSQIQRRVVGQLGRAWGRPMYEIELASLLSKWVGETEQRLKALFDQAQQMGFGLFLDEAHDFLGRRMEIRSTADRYSSMQINLVLQELDHYDSLLVLATTKPAALDPAILRRVLYRVHFEPLGPDERAAFWRALVPEGAPVASIRWRALGARFELGPDLMQKAMFHAAIEAAAQNAPLATAHIARAAQRLERGDG